MQILDSVSETITRLKEAENNLTRIRTEYKDEKDLLSFYEPSAQFLVDSIKGQVKTEISDYIGINNIDDADVQIRLKGPSFENGRAPLGIVGAFIKNFSAANQHAVTMLEQVKYEGKRITKRIKDLAELDLVGTAPGSLKLGLKKPTLDKFIMLCENEKQQEVYDEKMLIDTINKANVDTERSIEGLRLLGKAILASDDEEKFEQLYNEVKEPKNMLKLLHYVRELAPAHSSEISEIIITNLFDDVDNIKEVVFNNETRQRILERSKSLVKEGFGIKGVGIVREVDFDKMSFRINNLNIKEETLNNIECKVSKKYFNEHVFENIANRPVKIYGVLIYTMMGEPNYININDIELL